MIRIVLFTALTLSCLSCAKLRIDQKADLKEARAELDRQIFDLTINQSCVVDADCAASYYGNDSTCKPPHIAIYSIPNTNVNALERVLSDYTNIEIDLNHSGDQACTKIGYVADVYCDDSQTCALGKRPEKVNSF